MMYAFLLILFTALWGAPIAAFAHEMELRPSAPTQGAPVRGSEFEKLFYYTDMRGGVDALRANIAKIDIFAPQVYIVDASLKIGGGIQNEEVKQIIAAHNLKVMPLVANDRFRQAIIHNLLASSTAQDAVIQFMVEEALRQGYIGWQFDFEHIYYTDRARYTNFVKKTHEEFKKHNLLLSLAVVVRTNDVVNTFYKEWSGAFDYKALAANSDFLSVMTYDDPNSKGPVASIPYVTAALKYLKGNVPPEKISMGIPLYYWGWSTVPVKKIRLDGTYERLQMIRATAHFQEGFDVKLGVPWLTYWKDGWKYKVWFDNQKSFELKLGLMEKNKLRGFSAWVLGMEDPGIWDSLTANVASKRNAIQ